MSNRLIGISKNKTIAIAIAIFLMLSMSASMILTPTAAVTLAPGKISIATFAYINVSPNPAGLGQTVTIGFWLAEPPPTASAQYGDRWQGMTVLVTKPDGTTTTLGPFTSDDTGGTYTTYTPSQLGNYTFEMSFPGQILAGNNPPPLALMGPVSLIGDYYEPSTSRVATLTVQSQSVPSIPVTPLPTSYWQTPVNSENVNQWYSLTGNWLGLGQIFEANTGEYNESGNYNPYTTAPTTAHIMWTEPAAFGGVLGGEFGGAETSNYYATSQYEPKFAPIIMNGILYYEQYPTSSTNPTGMVAIDLYTGKTLWTSDTPLTLPTQTPTNTPTAGAPTVLLCGQVLDYVTPNQYGASAYLWTTGTPAEVAAATNIAPGSTTYNMFDAMTGTYILSIVNGSALNAQASGVLTEDEHGDLIGYFINSADNTLNMWNSTVCINLGANYGSILGAGPSIANNWEWRPPQGGIINFALGIEWSEPLATNISGVPIPPGTLSLGSVGADTGGSVNSGVVLLTSNFFSNGEAFFNPGFNIEAGYSATTGQQLWIVNRTETPFTRVDYCAVSNGIYVEVNQDTSAAVGYSVTTGTQLWNIVLPNTNPYDSTGGFENVVANGILYLYGFGGDIFAINMANGTIIWQTSTTTISGAAGSNTPYGVWPLWTFGLASLADGMLFVPEGHEYSPPLFRGAQQLAINITNGKPVWTILAFDVTNPPAIAYGIMTTLNAYDNQIYAYGVGPSKTTVTAPAAGVTVGTPVTITGSVMDISAGSQQEAVAANFPNGLPCVSDASMTQWMEYVYEQQPHPTNTTGVQVTLTAIDPNHNTVTLGTATTNILGDYGLSWTPPSVPGTYQIIATFSGTNSYYSSAASTYCTVSAAAPTAASTAAPQSGLATMSALTYGIVAVIIVIIIAIAIVGLLLLRKKP